VIGGLLGAIAGGVVGNRVNDRHRLAGTLVGAGVGGIAGLVVGSAIDAAGHRRHDDECALYLDRYLAEYPPTGYGYPGGYPAAYGYGYPVAMMPVLIQVPQRTIIRETVTEETWTETRPGPAHRRARHLPRREGKYVREN
jgi:hypothetical protein